MSNARCSHSLLKGKLLAGSNLFRPVLVPHGTRISNFKQKSDEPFHEAWERYKEYQRECPHHGFDDDYILEVFYDGVSYEFRNTLDSSSNGDFMTQTTPDDLTAKVDQLLKGNQSQVFIMEEAAPEKSAGDLAFDAEISGDDQQEASYVNGQGWQLKNYHPNPNVRNNTQVFWPKQDKPADPAQSNQGQYAGDLSTKYDKKRFTAAEKGKQKESEQPPADAPAAEKDREPTVGTNSPGPEQPAEAVRPIPEPVPAREYTPKVPYLVPGKATRKDREEMKCRKMLEDLTVRLPLMDAI
ncbi:PREDICTED: uncharacterized protein LOC106330626 [Brassica oleracea var. oleracea]|uniref:uncharacterized protein LOC106330626 n=1 Tax=Brassica oleracea var. oleracea TaxID=109376 RepID=UPI0006A6C77F|nr:PREDICTED: uncharacterized protein LOC106330626 [Brassica oleracea var. oleracea]